jgi:hypothetical protein
MDIDTASLNAGDAVVTDEGSTLKITVTADAETLWFNLP